MAFRGFASFCVVALVAASFGQGHWVAGHRTKSGTWVNGHYTKSRTSPHYGSKSPSGFKSQTKPPKAPKAPRAPKPPKSPKIKPIAPIKPLKFKNPKTPKYPTYSYPKQPRLTAPKSRETGVPISVHGDGRFSPGDRLISIKDGSGKTFSVNSESKLQDFLASHSRTGNYTVRIRRGDKYLSRKIDRIPF